MRTRRRSGGRRGKIASAAPAAFVIVLMLALSGVGLLAATGQADQEQEGTPRPTAPADDPNALDTRSPATRLVIPAIGVKSRLNRLGTTPDDTIELPPADGAGWYEESAAPGQPGLVIVAGYIRRSADEPGVFRQLRKLSSGDVIRVRRQDRRVAVYEVASIRAYAKKKFPVEAFYANDGEPVLRIVTTGGKIRPRAPQGNVIVEATLTDVR